MVHIIRVAFIAAFMLLGAAARGGVSERAAGEECARTAEANETAAAGATAECRESCDPDPASLLEAYDGMPRTGIKKLHAGPGPVHRDCRETILSSMEAADKAFSRAHDDYAATLEQAAASIDAGNIAAKEARKIKRNLVSAEKQLLKAKTKVKRSLNKAARRVGNIPERVPSCPCGD